MKLVSPGVSNPKTAKLAADLNVLSGIVHLAPADSASYTDEHGEYHALNSCAMSTTECASGCLGHSWRGDSVMVPRIMKTRWFFEHTELFLDTLVADIAELERKAFRLGRIPAMRLNGTSDILWERFPVTRDGKRFPHIFSAFPNVKFYDYTKIPRRTTSIPNYHLTFSLSENNDRLAVKELARGVNVAVVANAKPTEFPPYWGGYPTVNGDEHDFRFLDPRGGHIVLLSPKGPLRTIRTNIGGFIRHAEGGLEPTRILLTAAQARVQAR